MIYICNDSSFYSLGELCLSPLICITENSNYITQYILLSKNNYYLIIKIMIAKVMIVKKLP